MKEENKKKFRKFCKVSAYVGGLFAMLLLGMCLGNCSAKADSSNGKAVAESSLRYQKAFSPKRALDPASFPTLNESDDNLLLDASAGHYVLQSETLDGSVGGYRLILELQSDMYLIPLEVGQYVVDFSALDDRRLGEFCFLNDSGAEQVTKRFNGEPPQRVFLDRDDTTDWHDFIDGTSNGRVLLSVTSSFRWFFAWAYSFSVYDLKIAVYDPMVVSPIRIISFPDDYNPLSGFGVPNDGLVGQLSGNRSSPFRLDLLFRSGGHLFKRIDFYFLPMQGMEYVSTLNSTGNPSVFSGSGFVYCSVIEYISADGVSFTAWRSIFGTKSDGNVYFRNFGEWTSKQYQTLDVILYTPVFGQSGAAPNLDQVGILELRTSSGVPTPVIGGNSNADVFSLLATGFQSVAGLLNIQILPFLTLGTLLFVPLVVMIIFAILKVLNK